MFGYWTTKKFIIDRLSSITNVASRVPGGIHENEVPAELPNGQTTANKMAIVYQVEFGNPLLGQGATHVWDELSVLITVQVPGTSEAPGRTLTEDIYTALHTQSGSNAYGSVSSCVFRGFVGTVPEHIAATGEDYEHLTQRYELHGRGV